MSNPINQERRMAVERLVIPEEDMKRLSKLPIMPSISHMLVESLDRNCVEPLVLPGDAD